MNRSIGKEISHIARSMNRYLDQKAAHLSLSHSSIPFLTYLYSHNGVHQDELAENLLYDKSSATRAVTALEKQGYVIREVDKNNKRRNRIIVTPKGYTIKDELFMILQNITKKLFKGFSDEEINIYFELTMRMDSTVSKMLESVK